MAIEAKTKAKGEKKMSDEKKKEVVDEFAGVEMPDYKKSEGTAPEAEPKQKRKPGRPKTEGKEKKSAKPTLSPREKVAHKILHRAGKTEAPDLASVVKGRTGKPTKVKDIAIFLGGVEDEVLKGIAKECPLKNQAHLNTEVCLDNMMKVGIQIFEKGRMLSNITVARIEETKTLECIAGRHRLALFALIYGAEAEIPVIIEDMTLNEARDAVVVANQARAVKALEQAEHAAMAAVGGNLDVKQDELYEKLVRSKSTVGKYCVFSVYDRKHPIKLGFKLAKTQSRKDGGMTTLAIVEAFWKASLTWEKGMPRKDFDSFLKGATEFLNDFVETIQGVKGFDASQHLASMTLVAVGKYFRSHIKGTDHAAAVSKVAKTIVAMGDIGRQKSEKTFKALCNTLQK